MITKQESNILKAIAIISIIISHFWGWISPPPDFIKVLFGSISQAGVSIFLFLSGYGIKSSYDFNGIHRFWIRRLEKIYIPLLIVTIPEFVYRIWYCQKHMENIFWKSSFLSVLGLYPSNVLDGTLWFITFILMQYLIFYLSFRVKSENKYKNYILLACGTVIVYFVFKKYFTWVNSCDIYAFSFFAGVLYKDFFEKKKYNKWMIIIIVTIFITSLSMEGMAVGRFLNACTMGMLEMILIHAIRWKSIVLQFIGNHSFELYLTEAIFFFHSFIYDKIGYNYVALMVHLGVIMVLSILIKKVTGNVYNIFRMNIGKNNENEGSSDVQ